MNSGAEQIVESHGNGIVYEPSRLRKADCAPTASLFEPDFWLAKGIANETRGGRGSVWFVRAPTHRWVLRHYRRGGLMAHVVQDRYLWTGANATRAFREWRLLAHLHAQGLPVPAPVAARYLRRGFTYTADLITEELPASRSLAQCLSAAPQPSAAWRAVGASIARFHRAGAYHADLNAHNILLTTDHQVFLLDFDRGRLRAPGAWREAVLKRLLRSLHKLHAQGRIRFEESDWRELLAGYKTAATPHR